MKKRMVFSLFAAVTAGSLLLSGCSGIDLTSVNQEDTTLSAEMEQENLSDGTITLHSVWYDTDNAPLTSATVTFLDGKEELFSGETDENGNLEVCTLTGNTTLTCKITDSTGETLAKAEIVCKISGDYESLTVYPVGTDGNSEHILELPSAKTNVRAAVYLTEDKEITVANLSPYYESADTTTEEETSEGDTADTSSTDETADENAASTEDTATDGSATDGTAATTENASTDGTAAQ